MARNSKLTNVLNIEDILIIEDVLAPGAELDAVRYPYRCVVLVEEAFIWLLSAVVRTLTPFMRQMGGSAKYREENMQ